METKKENLVYINDKQVSVEELEQLKESVRTSKDIQLVEISPNNFKTRLFG